MSRRLTSYLFAGISAVCFATSNVIPDAEWWEVIAFYFGLTFWIESILLKDRPW